MGRRLSSPGGGTPFAPRSRARGRPSSPPEVSITNTSEAHDYFSLGLTVVVEPHQLALLAVHLVEYPEHGCW